MINCNKENLKQDSLISDCITSVECESSEQTDYNPKIIFYPNRKTFTSKTPIKISNVIEFIKTDHSIFKNVKHNLPVAYFSVTDFHGPKEIANIVNHTGLIVIDIDKKDNLDLDLIDLKETLIKDPYIYFLFNSPSGGIKFVVHTNLKNTAHHYYYYDKIYSYFTSKYTFKIDTSGKNPNRGCYMCRNTDTYVNYKSKIFTVDETELNQIKILPKKSKRKFNNSIDYISLDEGKLIELFTDFLKKRTELSLYNDLFNEARYKNIYNNDDPVRYLEQKMDIENIKIEKQTNIDYSYFIDNNNKTIDIRMFEGFEKGIAYCNYYFTQQTVFKEKQRARTLYHNAIKILFNNPLIYPLSLFDELIRINDLYSEDPQPIQNPKPNELEIKGIVNEVYHKYINFELDFSNVIYKRKNGEVKGKKIFHSKYCDLDKITKLKNALNAFWQPHRDKVTGDYFNAVKELQDGSKITQKRIAAYINVSVRTLRRYDFSAYDKIIKDYNLSLKEGRN